MSATRASLDFLADKAQRVRAERGARALNRRALERLRKQACALPAPPRFAAALRAGDFVAVIGEYKRRSPSGGVLAGDEEPRTVAAAYAAAGARAVSVLTDAADFGGSLDDLSAVTQNCVLPALCKDFVVDETHLLEARLAGASAVLLIVRMLAPRELDALLRTATELGLECLVEIHDERELAAAAAAGATLIGINNRDLGTLATDVRSTERLAPLVPSGATVVSESGIRDAEAVARVAGAGAHAVLIGEALLRVREPARAELLAGLAAVPRR